MLPCLPCPLLSNLFSICSISPWKELTPPSFKNCSSFSHLVSGWAKENHAQSSTNHHSSFPSYIDSVVAAWIQVWFSIAVLLNFTCRFWERGNVSLWVLLIWTEVCSCLCHVSCCVDMVLHLRDRINPRHGEKQGAERWGEGGWREREMISFDWGYSSPDLLRYEPDHSDFFLSGLGSVSCSLKSRLLDKFICLFIAMATL